MSCDWRERFVQRKPFSIRAGVMVPEDVPLDKTTVSVVSYDATMAYSSAGGEGVTNRFLLRLEKSISRARIPGVARSSCIITVPDFLLGDKIGNLTKRSINVNVNAMFRLEKPFPANSVPGWMTEWITRELWRVWNEIAEASSLECKENKMKEKKEPVKRKANMPLGIMRKVIQYDLEGNEVGRYDSVTEAAYAVNRSRGAVTKVLTGRMKECNGFTFKYA